MLEGELDGADAIERGCGTAYVSSWLARRGAKPVGIDNSQASPLTWRTAPRCRSSAAPSVGTAARPRPL